MVSMKAKDGGGGSGGGGGGGEGGGGRGGGDLVLSDPPLSQSHFNLSVQ